VKKFTIVVSMVALVGALITPTSANAALRVPKTSWPVCTTADQDFCVESVSVSLNAGAAIPLTWVASGTATPVTPVAAPAPAASPTPAASHLHHLLHQILRHLHHQHLRPLHHRHL